MRQKGIAGFGVLILLIQFAIIAFGSGFENFLGVIGHALTIGGGALLVLTGFDADRFGSRVRWSHFAGTGLALAGLGFSVSGLVGAGVGTESIDRIAAGGRILSALVLVRFGWQIAFDTRHVNFEWMNSAN